MSEYMVQCTFKEGTDMSEVLACVAEEQAAVATLAAQGRVGDIRLSLSRGTVFIVAFADTAEDAELSVRALPMAKWWNTDVFPVAAPAIAGGGQLMSSFTSAEIEYLTSQPLMRFASSSPTGRPDVAPVIFELDGEDIVTGGFDITHTVRYRNIRSNPRVSVVIDDLATIDPWSPRGIKVIGTATIEMKEGSPRFRISPEIIISWAINDTTPGIPRMERRKVG